ncbi:class I SAM-dependent methyltransferase [[Bacillus] enclensis]|uniref:class I SAM-dependent methyltransferase n=1 Tax=[Bacillus] enclensis TaxID=1402860 RepID=UPI0018DE6439|nr:class I SAM-dependent methyltransferase [[Bacillus] enclensis]MBH9964682.1 methyltransferase domain-containing protein [[Bacillus] enclensis]
MTFSLQKQFRQPKGILGWMIGKVMEIDNRKINKWSINKMPIRRGDHILEIGYGPGYCIQKIIQKYPGCTVDGVDISSTMKEAAGQKNKDAIKKEKVHLFVHDISEFQLEDKQYDHIFSVNNYPLWSDTDKALSHLYHMLKPGGTLVITVQPRGEEEKDSRARGYGREISERLTSAGFKNIETSYKKIRPSLTVLVKCEK